MIDDPTDEKPEDWDERMQIPDESAVKPDDWDEDAPQMIPDESATLPEGWLEDEPKLIANPEAEKPEDWWVVSHFHLNIFFHLTRYVFLYNRDTDTDGDWEPPMIENPACTSAPGCGKWTKPLIPNKAYKGKWEPPLIANKNYKGKWSPKQIPNPSFFEDKAPYRMTPIVSEKHGCFFSCIFKII